ncbi:PREDICTED: ribonuclease H1-like [Wasmannia auropunctata]|uniref:ribonuclease H1-like n=1 Tax=Wasmannia auropunctata TaxID=64793 RepID=UPI0005F003AD|nr:PREDICTED: ribonuclease H1-like [Wasmannia auropunctata]
MPKKNYYAVANGRQTGVYDNWQDCKDQVDGYSRNNFKGFSTPDKAWDFVDQHSSGGNRGQSFDSNSRAVASRSGNQVASRGGQGEVNFYRSTDYTEGRNSVIVRERSYASGSSGNGHFVEKSTRTYWKENK